MGSGVVKIPLESLREEVLRGIVEEFVLREGTDYGPVEYSLEEKVGRVIKQLKSGAAEIVFDEKEESCNIVRC